MNEENLGTLFAELPKQCVVLLEDIDTAGLTHTRDTKTDENQGVKPAVPAAPGVNFTAIPAGPTGRLSLSALLNIIDGVAATEGRILIMTTNHLEKLDEALIRPGRVDMTVKFGLASTSMIKTIFCGIFATLEGDVPKAQNILPSTRSPKISSTGTSKSEGSECLDGEKEAVIPEARRVADEAKVYDMGSRFAEIVPAMIFSPAEIQGFLLKHKREPELAVANAVQWVTKTKTEKVKQKNNEEKKEKQRLELEMKGADEKAVEKANDEAVKENGKKVEVKDVSSELEPATD